MRAAVIREHGDRDVTRVVRDYPDPQAGPGWVVVRVGATSLNFHDIFTRRGMPGIRIPFPLIVGSDLAGEIVEVGQNVSGWSLGDRVLVDPLPCEGTEWKFIGEQFDGGRAEYCAVHSEQLINLPDTVSYEQAASLPLAYATAYRMMLTRGGVKAGEKVLILGASGGVGTCCVLLAKMVGAEVIACASSDAKLDRLGEIGADHLVNYKQVNMRKAVHEIVGKPRVTRTGGVDLAVNYTGGKTWKDTLRCVGFGGRMVTCGATAGYEEEVDCRYTWTFEHSIIGSDGWTRDELVALLGMVESGDLDPVIDRVLPLDEIHEAERLLEDREVFGKVLVTPG
ncbi:MAG: zinc-binding dehydrogenase [Gammaproteobacteria bacterium]|nr:zinc-binding dehydrogenase [Chromatiales bacterium]MYE49720.1 zinc-binding dehydrogenase [Gammaproteobacteria bacterium]